MSAVVESRRFRTWDESRPLEADNRVRLMIKAQLLRYQRNWYFWILFSLAVLFALASLLTPFIMAAESWVGAESLAGIYLGTGGILAAVTLLLIAAPTIAEDLRFNAPLFYFSRPLRVGDYLAGKIGFIFMVMGTFLGVALAMTLIGSLLTIDADAPAQRSWCTGACYERMVADWEVNAINSFGDWAFMALVLVTGTLSVLAFAATLMVMISAMTRRAWHAAVGFLVVGLAWGLIGLGLGFVVSDDAMAMVWGPFGWAAATTFIPIEAHFSGPTNPFLDNVASAAMVSHLLLWAWTAVFVTITWRRLKGVEGAL